MVKIGHHEMKINQNGLISYNDSVFGVFLQKQTAICFREIIEYLFKE